MTILLRVLRVLRGGSWIFDARYVRCANRHVSGPGNRDEYFGFRPVAEVKEKGKKR
jgi:formylglycine-generating enzyme required for sulfatase activity